MEHLDPLDNINRLSTIRDALNSELMDTVGFYVYEMATLRRIKEKTTEQEIREQITGIIMDELTIINNYREELC